MGSGFDDLDYCGPWVPTPPTSTECKHGRKECAKCGTTNRRDALHTTYSGKGKVGQLIARAKKKR